MTKFIATVSDAADQAREANNGIKDIALSFDEWGVWYSDKVERAGRPVEGGGRAGFAPRAMAQVSTFVEDIYTAADAVVEGSPDDHPASSTAIACVPASRAQLVNVIAPITGRGTRPGMAGRPRSTVRRSRPSRAQPRPTAPAISSPTIHTEGLWRRGRPSTR